MVDAAAESNVIIFSDDPDATEKLVDKIERLKKRQGVMKRANQLIRKADREGLAPTSAIWRIVPGTKGADSNDRTGFNVLDPPSLALPNVSLSSDR